MLTKLKLICSYLWILFPALMIYCIINLSETLYQIDMTTPDSEMLFPYPETFYFMIIMLYLFTVAAIVFFAVFKPFNIWCMAGSFILSPLPMYISESKNQNWRIDLGTLLIVVYYAFPFLLISIILAVVLKVIKDNKNYQNKIFKDKSGM